MKKIVKHVLFLDFDGVLNSTQFFIMRQRKMELNRASASNTVVHYTELDDFCPIGISNLNHILELCPSLDIVISSSWRLYRKLDQLKSLLQQVGVIDVSRVIGMTPHNRKADETRGMEIQQWLDAHPEVERFAILDDDTDMGHLTTHLFKTNAMHGLSLEMVHSIIKFFNPDAEIL